MDQILSAVTVAAAGMVAVAVIMVIICSRFLSVATKLGEALSTPAAAAPVPAVSAYASPAIQAAPSGSPAAQAPLVQTEAAAPAFAATPAPQSVNLHGVDDKTAAMLMAIVAYKTGLSPDSLRFLSIREC